MRSVGSKALSNVTSQFSKLNPISRLKRNTQKEFTDIRQKELDLGNELDMGNAAFEEDFDEDLKYLNSLHLPSSGLLMKSDAVSDGDQGVSLNVQSNSISFSKSQSHSNSQLSSSISPSTDPSSSSNHLVPGGRTRKLSKSTEDIPEPSKPPVHHLDMFVPFSRITKGLQTIGSNIDSKLGHQEASAAAYQYVTPQTRPAASSPNSNVRANNMSADVEDKIKSSGTTSFILFI